MTGPRPAIHVVGLAGDRPATPEGAAALADATLVAGGALPLAALRERVGAASMPETVVLGAPLAPALQRIAAHDGPVAVLASGDPGWFGIVRTLARRSQFQAAGPAGDAFAVRRFLAPLPLRLASQLPDRLAAALQHADRRAG